MNTLWVIIIGGSFYLVTVSAILIALCWMPKEYRGGFKCKHCGCKTENPYRQCDDCADEINAMWGK